MKVYIQSSAKQDLLDGFRFYEKQSKGIGQYFIDSIYSDIDSLMINAGSHAVYFNKYHRLLSKRFPFAIYYQFNNYTVYIHAVLDCRAEPAWVRSKLP